MKHCTWVCFGRYGARLILISPNHQWRSECIIDSPVILAANLASQFGSNSVEITNNAIFLALRKLPFFLYRNDMGERVFIVFSA